MSRVLIPKCPLWKFLQYPSRHQTLVSDFSVLVLPLSRRGAQKTHGPWFDFSLGTPPNRLSQQMMWPWIYLRRAFSLCLLSHVYGQVFKVFSNSISSWSSSLSWIDGPAFSESSPSPVLALVSSAARPHSSTRFDVMFGLQPKTSLISSKCSKVSRSFPLRELWSFTLLYSSWRYFIRALHWTPVQKLEIFCSFRMLFNFFAMVSHAPLFLLLLIGKLSLHISKRNLVSASDQFRRYLWKMRV